MWSGGWRCLISLSKSKGSSIPSTTVKLVTYKVDDLVSLASHQRNITNNHKKVTIILSTKKKKVTIIQVDNGRLDKELNGNNE